MANYESVLVSTVFTVKPEDVENVKRAISYFEESYVDSKNNAFIGSYEQTVSDDLMVVIDTRNNKVLGVYDNCYQDLEDFLDENIEERDYEIEDFKEVPFDKYIQSVLVNGEHVFIKEVGHEKLRYACACGLFISRDRIEWFDLDRLVEKECNVVM